MSRFKKFLFWCSWVFGILLIIFLTNPARMENLLCGGNEFCGLVVRNIFFAFLFLSPLFIFSIITYFLRDEVFRTWFLFAFIWSSASLIVNYMTPDLCGYPGYMFTSCLKPFVMLALGFLFFIISLIVVIYKAVNLRATSSAQ